MKFKIGDKVVFSNSVHLPKWLRDLRDKNISGTVIKKCSLVPTDCNIVKLSNGYKYHLFNRWLQKVKIKNQQLLFAFMD